VITICGPVDDFDPEGYLYINPDIAAHPHETSDAEWATSHFEHHGRDEGRIQLRGKLLPDLMAARREKMEQLFRRSTRARQKLEPFAFECCSSLVEIATVPDDRLPVPFERISAHSYDPSTDEWIDGDPDQLFLEIGSGLTRDYRHNVVYTDIAALPTVDVMCFGDVLPFDDETFDGIVCLAVLEHVPNPFAVAAEMARVVRPGGRMVIDWPFLQPVHGYPHHYLNATEEGAREVFSQLGGLDIESFTPQHMHPAFALHWFLQEWEARLTGERRQAFRDLTLADILSSTPSDMRTQEWAAIDNETVISAGTRLVVTKRSASGNSIPRNVANGQ
jgi:SAM-dependent methyltransferase